MEDQETGAQGEPAEIVIDLLCGWCYGRMFARDKMRVSDKWHRAYKCEDCNTEVLIRSVTVIVHEKSPRPKTHKGR